MSRAQDNNLYKLTRNNFESSVLKGFRDLRSESDLFDITLGCSDGFLQAHKVILSASSLFFKSMFKQQDTHISNNQKLFLFLKGVSFLELSYLLDYIYHGEVNVAEKDLDSFMNVSEDLQVEGLRDSRNDTSSSSSKLAIQKRNNNFVPIFDPMQYEEGFSNMDFHQRIDQQMVSQDFKGPPKLGKFIDQDFKESQKLGMSSASSNNAMINTNKQNQNTGKRLPVQPIAQIKVEATAPMTHPETTSYNVSPEPLQSHPTDEDKIAMQQQIINSSSQAINEQNVMVNNYENQMYPLMAANSYPTTSTTNNMQMQQPPLRDWKPTMGNNMNNRVTDEEEEHFFKLSDDVKEWQCKLCEKKKNSKQLMKDHITSEHFPTTEPCIYCHKMQRGGGSLRNHMYACAKKMGKKFTLKVPEKN